MSRKSAHEITLKDLGKDEQKTVLEIARKSPEQLARDAAEVTAIATGKNVDGTRRRKPRAAWNDDEHIGQSLFFQIELPKLVAKYGEHLSDVLAIPNFSMGHPSKGVRMMMGARAKAEGRKKGTWDILYPHARGGYHMLWIEAKIRPKTLSPEQEDFGMRMMIAGNLCVPIFADTPQHLAMQIAGTIEYYETMR